MVLWVVKIAFTPCDVVSEIPTGSVNEIHKKVCKSALQSCSSYFVTLHSIKYIWNDFIVCLHMIVVNIWIKYTILISYLFYV